MVNIVLFYVYWLYQLLQVHKLIAFIQVLNRKSIDCSLIILLNQVSVNHVTTPISIMFSRIGVNEDCAEFVSNYIVPTIQESCKVLVKRHASYNLCPTPIKKIQKTSIEQASSLSVLKLKLSNTSYVNSQLSNPIDIIPEAFERLYTKHNEIR